MRLGYDYGAKPTMIIVGDTEFPDFLATQEFLALVYDQLPKFGLLVNPPRLSMVFRNIEIGRNCFTHFKNWTDISEDGDAIRISFIEYKDNSYGMCISQDVDRLVKRIIPKNLHNEVELKMLNVGQIRIFTKEGNGYEWFKSEVQKSPFILAPRDVKSAPIRELALRKREVQFFQEDNIPEHTVEYSLFHHKNAKNKGDERQVITSNIALHHNAIYKRRRLQLSRFFPVTLERLRFNKKFLEVKSKLIEEGCKEWQILQAACNIALRHSVPELFLSEKKQRKNTKNSNKGNKKQSINKTSENDQSSAMLNILEFLINHHEDLSRVLPPNEWLSLPNLKAQIQADSLELLIYTGKSKYEDLNLEELQTELEKNDLLTE